MKGVLLGQVLSLSAQVLSHKATPKVSPVSAALGAGNSVRVPETRWQARGHHSEATVLYLSFVLFGVLFCLFLLFLCFQLQA